MKKTFLLLSALLFGAMRFVSCSSDDDDNNSSQDQYSDKSYGQAAINSCGELNDALVAANERIGSSSLTESQNSELKSIVNNLVDNVIIPTYTDLADDAEELQKALNGLNVNSITQSDVDKACTAFKKARQHWERSEAFLMGPASDFDIDPTIDSWPLNRSLLISYLSSGNTDFTEEQLDDASILGFHALEFILFRNGKNRNVSEFTGNDTYKGFTKISGASELAYAQRICALLVERTYQLQVAWEGETASNADRLAVLKAAGLEYVTESGITYGDNLKMKSGSRFNNIKEVVAQILSDDEGSCAAITDEVGSAKIANPFSAGFVFYVESPFSYNSITDFQDNIRSVRNIWLGSLNGKAATHSFYNFFKENQTKLGNDVEDAYESAISNIGKMPAPFVKYVSTIWNVSYEDDDRTADDLPE